MHSDPTDVGQKPNLDQQKVSVSGIPYYLPKGRVVVGLVTVKRGERELDLRLKIEPDPSLYPDPEERYVLRMDEDAFSHDRFCVARDVDGLLTAIDMASANVLDEMIITIAETAKAFSLMGRLALPASDQYDAGMLTFEELRAEEVEVPIYSAEFDPFEPNEVAQVQREIDGIVQPFSDRRRAEIAVFEDNTCAPARDAGTLAETPKLNELCSRLKTLDQKLFNRAATSFAVPAEYGPPSDSEKRTHCNATHGVCFRTLIAVPMDVTFSNEASRVTVRIPDYRFVGNFDLKRTLMVEKEIRVRMQRGVLESVVVDKPSEGLEVASLPLEVLNAVLDVPAKFFGKIAAGFTSEAEATRAQADLIKAQAERDKVLIDTLSDAQKPSGQPPPTATDIGKPRAPDVKIDVTFTCTPDNPGKTDG